MSCFSARPKRSSRHTTSVSLERSQVREQLRHAAAISVGAAGRVRKYLLAARRLQRVDLQRGILLVRRHTVAYAST